MGTVDASVFARLIRPAARLHDDTHCWHESTIWFAPKKRRPQTETVHRCDMALERVMERSSGEHTIDVAAGVGHNNVSLVWSSEGNRVPIWDWQ